MFIGGLYSNEDVHRAFERTRSDGPRFADPRETSSILFITPSASDIREHESIEIVVRNSNSARYLRRSTGRVRARSLLSQIIEWTRRAAPRLIVRTARFNAACT
jgi:hypothetical protein